MHYSAPGYPPPVLLRRRDRIGRPAILCFSSLVMVGIILLALLSKYPTNPVHHPFGLGLPVAFDGSAPRAAFPVHAIRRGRNCSVNTTDVGAPSVIDEAEGPRGSATEACRVLVTSPNRAVDSNGRVCHPRRLSATRCCPDTAAARNEVRDACAGDAFQDGLACDPKSRCCADQAICTACCLNVRLLAFAKCVAACRHSSKSVFHQNRYLSDTHHCFA
jgi:hypothetical protein